MKTFLKFSVFVLAMVLFLACEKVTEISLNKNELYLAPGETETLIATVYPTDAYHKKANWTSSNPAVATVTDNGLVTAIESGKTIITASSQDGNKTAICFITVDYRAKWVGSYDCERKGGSVIQVIIDVNVKGDSILYITERGLDVDQYGSSTHGVHHDMKVDSDGDFKKRGEGKPYISGRFCKDSIYIDYTDGSPNYTVTFKYKGKKQK